MADQQAGAQTWFWRVWVVIGVVLLVWAVGHVFAGPLRLLLPPLALAGILIYLLNPVVSWFARHGVPRVVGTTAAYLILGGAAVGLVALVAPLLVAQTSNLIDKLPDIAVALQNTINGQLARLGFDARVAFDPQATETQAALQRLFQDNSDQLAGLLRGAGAVVAGLVAGLVAVVLAPVLAFYALIDLPRLTEGMRRLVPPTSRSEVVDVSRRILSTVGAYVRGQLLVAIFVAVATAVGLAVVRLPFWALVGALAGMFNLIPFVGPFVGGALGVLVALTTGGGVPQAVGVVIVMVIVQQLDNHVITPNIISRTVHVHPITILLALSTAASLFGILGMLVAIPVLAAIKLVVVYILVTRVPAFAHLAGDGPEVIDGVRVGSGREPGLVAMGRELRNARERRRRRSGATAAASTDPTTDEPAKAPGDT